MDVKDQRRRSTSEQTGVTSIGDQRAAAAVTMNIPTDILVEILVRLPWTSRRRLRLVCRSWRNLIHQRTTEMKERRDAVPLVVTTESAYLLYDLDSSKTCIRRQLWSRDTNPYRNKEVVGVSNGVVCLCDDAVPGGAITLVNPATGDVLALPPFPCAGLIKRHKSRGSGRSWHQAYSFGYHHGAGQFKVVQVPCFFKSRDVLHVFTLGEASWREVLAPAAKCKLETGLVSVNGATYWVSESDGWQRIMYFDLESEQVTCTTPLPNSARAAGPICHLSETQRRLSITFATSDDSYRPYHGRGYGSIEVWMLECTRKEQTWIHQCSLRPLPLPERSIRLARPNFLHGEYVLMVEGQGKKLRPYRPSKDSYGIGPKSSAVRTEYFSPNGTISNLRGDICQTFSYVRNTDALSVYKRW